MQVAMPRCVVASSLSGTMLQANTTNPMYTVGCCAGAGSGYLTAAMAKLVQPGGFVLGVEKVPELVQHAKRAIATGEG